MSQPKHPKELFVKLPKGEVITVRGQKITLTRAVMIHLRYSPEADAVGMQVLNDAAGIGFPTVALLSDPKDLKRKRIYRQWAKAAGYIIEK